MKNHAKMPQDTHSPGVIVPQQRVEPLRNLVKPGEQAPDLVLVAILLVAEVVERPSKLREGLEKKLSRVLVFPRVGANELFELDESANVSLLLLPSLVYVRRVEAEVDGGRVDGPLVRLQNGTHATEKSKPAGQDMVAVVHCVVLVAQASKGYEHGHDAE